MRAGTKARLMRPRCLTRGSDVDPSAGAGLNASTASRELFPSGGVESALNKFICLIHVGSVWHARASHLWLNIKCQGRLTVVHANLVAGKEIHLEIVIVPEV